MRRAVTLIFRNLNWIVLCALSLSIANLSITNYSPRSCLVGIVLRSSAISSAISTAIWSWYSCCVSPNIIICRIIRIGVLKFRKDRLRNGNAIHPKSLSFACMIASHNLLEGLLESFTEDRCLLDAFQKAVYMTVVWHIPRRTDLFAIVYKFSE